MTHGAPSKERKPYSHEGVSTELFREEFVSHMAAR